uniref:Uncharacterized protein n=1 Tax=Nelumbo nucifera TaxID=4432 RepID=A0A822YGX7_NELNU|nr:TPA_asm: hypothetical protein HUJ06_010543 [Nelumbo nucifera]
MFLTLSLSFSCWLSPCSFFFLLKPSEVPNAGEALRLAITAPHHCNSTFVISMLASEDVFANDSIELLRQSGMDFKKNNEKGIDAHRFGELLMSSGIVLNDSVLWMTFNSGYDFSYLLKLLTCQNLPDT